MSRASQFIVDPSGDANNKICRDSLTDENDDDSSSGSESISRSISFAPNVAHTLLPPSLSPRVVSASRVVPMSNDSNSNASASLNAKVMNSGLGSLKRVQASNLPSKKRPFDSLQTEPIKPRMRQTKGAPAVGGVKYKSKGAGAASWNAAVRKDIGKVQVSASINKHTQEKSARRSYSDSPSSSVPDNDADGNPTEFLCDVCEDAIFPTYAGALAHEKQCRATRKMRGKTIRINSTEAAAVPTSLIRAVTDENTTKGYSGYSGISMSPKMTTFSRAISNDHNDFACNTQVSLTSLKRAVTDDREVATRASSVYDQEDEVMLCSPTQESKATSKLVLATKEDKHWLSDLVCLIRENIEVFAATADDVTARSRRGGIKKPIALGRVGIRCIHCVNVPHDQKAKGAVSYPNSIRIVHQAVRNWQRYHFDACDKIPASVRRAYAALKSTRSHSGNASLKYWIDSTTNLGLVDTNAEDGIRFAEGKKPNDLNSNEQAQEKSHVVHDQTPSDDSEVTEVPRTYLSSTVSEIDRPMDDIKYEQPSLVVPSDKPLITDFLYELLDQQQACQYKAVDRNGKRKYRNLGFPGVECKHCARNAGAGRYFPLMVTTLANNNNPFNCTHSHMMKCRRCPQEVKNKLAQLQLMHAEQGAKLPSGWKKTFFDKLWVRLHGTNSSKTSDSSDESLEEEDNNVEQSNSSNDDDFDNDIDSAAYALSKFSAQAFSDAAKAGLRNTVEF